MVYNSIHLTDEQISRFKEDGFLVIDKLLDMELVNRLISRVDRLTMGDFETGIYPDEWHGNPRLSLPNATRQLAGVWKSDKTIASVSLSAEIGRLMATLAGWPGARLTMDTLWVKPPGAPEVTFHRDVTYATCLNPPENATCWIALSDATSEAGTLEYVPGSHKWLYPDALIKEFHAPTKDYRQTARLVAAELGIKDPKFVTVEVPTGGCIFHHWNIWHGSGKNKRSDQIRRSFGIHTCPSNACFQPPGVGYGYIFGRYRHFGSTIMDESFFPILWTRDGYRSAFLADYCKDALATTDPTEVPITSV